MPVLSKQVLSESLDDEVIDLTWFCMQQPVTMNILFKKYFFDLDILAETASDAGISHYPGLLKALQGEEPPHVSFFTTLPLPAGLWTKWAVYVIILKAPDGTVLVYIGSGTNAADGVQHRFVTYNKSGDYTESEPKKSALPEYMKEAIAQGCKVIHKGLLAWCRKPSYKDVARFRLLFGAMEAAFSFHFWAMKRRDMDYGRGDCCPWSREDFDYSYYGLCSHSSLNDFIKGNFDLTPEEIESLVVSAEEQRRRHNAKQYKRIRELDLEGYRARVRRNSATYRQNSADKKRANEERFRAKAKDEKRHYCNTCGVACTGAWELQRHNGSRRHKLAVKRQANGKLKYHCFICDSYFTHPCHLERHKQSKRHLEKVAMATASDSD